MFFPEKMRKVNIFVKKDDVEPATIALARLEQLHLSRSGDEDWSERTPGWRKLVDAYEDRIHRVKKLMRVLQIADGSSPGSPGLRPHQDTELVDQTLEEIERQVERWQDERRRIEKQSERLQNLIRETQLLSGLDTPIEEIRKPEYLHRLVGTIPRRNLENLKVVLFRVPFVIIPLSTGAQRVLIVAATSRNYSEILERALQIIFFEPVTLEEEMRGAPAEALQRFEQQKADCDRQRVELEQERAALAEDWAHRLVGLRYRIESNLRVARAVTGFDRHENVFLISGWIPERAVDSVMTTVANATEGRADIEMVTPLPGGRRRVPTFLRNPLFLRPFEKIVSTFGFPEYEEIDPTPLVAISFILMYGMMFGDVGHGLMLAGIGVWIRRRFDSESGVIGTVLTTAGLSAAVFGFLYGSFFGREDILPALWLHPLESIGQILIASVLAGIVLINIGFSIHLVKTIRTRNWGSFLFGRSGVAGIGLYWALVGGGYAAFHEKLPLEILAVLVAAPTVAIFLQEPLMRLVSGERPLVEESWATFGAQAFFETFETLIRFVSNTLSFVRLGAFAVAHAGFIGVVFALAETGGELLQWPVLLLGTLLVVGFEGLIVGIQALRLEYYEFFGKFYQGGGRRFAPLRLPDSQ